MYIKSSERVHHDVKHGKLIVRTIITFFGVIKTQPHRQEIIKVTNSGYFGTVLFEIFGK